MSETEFEYRSAKEKDIELKYKEEYLNNIEICNLAMDSVRYQNVESVQNLGGQINTAADEYFPFLTNNQEYLFYTTRASQFDDENLFLSEVKEGKYTRGTSVSNNINSSGNEGMSTIVKDGRKIYFTACDRRQVMGTCDIWEADLKNKKITNEKPLTGYANSGKWESQASISCDGTLLYFASNREGGLGGTDIWLSRKLPDGRWGKPENLGAPINTPKDEEAPFITNDGFVLYFSSNGHIGLGEQDIFMARQQTNGHWSEPVNLGTPVNSAYRELGFFLTADGQTGYFASDRESGFGGMDIYKFKLPEQLTSYPITYVEGIVRDSIYNLPVVTTLFFDKQLPIKTDKKGRFFRCVPAGEEWNFNVHQKGFKPYRSSVTIPRWDNKEFYPVEILLKPKDYLLNLSENKREEELASTIVMQKIYFDVDKYKLSIENHDNLKLFLNKCLNGKYRIGKVDIVGFADASGGDAYNMMLSEKRAKSVAVYLEENGIRVDRIYMGAEGAIKDGGEEAAWRNRRVELRIKLIEKEKQTEKYE